MKSYLLPVEDLVVVYANDEEFLKGKFVYTQREVLGIDIGLCYLNELVDDENVKRISFKELLNTSNFIGIYTKNELLEEDFIAELEAYYNKLD